MSNTIKELKPNSKKKSNIKMESIIDLTAELTFENIFIKDEIQAIDFSKMTKTKIQRNLYSYIKQSFFKNKDDILIQLAFIEVIYEWIWEKRAKGELMEVQQLFQELSYVEKDFSSEDFDIKQFLLYVKTNALLSMGLNANSIHVLINNYYKLLDWEILTHSLEYENGFEDVYMSVVYNLYQLLLIIGKKGEAKLLYEEHIEIIEYMLSFYDDKIMDSEIWDPEEYSEWKKLHEIINNGEIGCLYILSEFNKRVIEGIQESKEIRSMIYEYFIGAERKNGRCEIQMDFYIDYIELKKEKNGIYKLV